MFRNFQFSSEQCTKIFENLRVTRIVCKVGELVWVGVVIVEFNAVTPVVPFSASPPPCTDAAAPILGVGTTAGLCQCKVVHLGVFASG